MDFQPNCPNSQGSVCFVLKFALPPFSPPPLPSGVQISKQNTHWTFDTINNLSPVYVALFLSRITQGWVKMLATGCKKWVIKLGKGRNQFCNLTFLLLNPTNPVTFLYLYSWAKKFLARVNIFLPDVIPKPDWNICTLEGPFSNRADFSWWTLCLSPNRSCWSRPQSLFLSAHYATVFKDPGNWSLGLFEYRNTGIYSVLAPPRPTICWGIIEIMCHVIVMAYLPDFRLCKQNWADVPSIPQLCQQQIVLARPVFIKK